MTTLLADWPDTSHADPPRGHAYRAATWLLGRHPRPARLAARITGVVEVEDDELTIDLQHLATVVAAAPAYDAAWQDYERTHHPPRDEADWDRWQDAGPKADAFAIGLADFLVMSSGEVAAVRLLATLALERIPFRVADICSLDEEGQRLLADWAAAVQRT